MSYVVESRNDLTRGMVLVVRIPQAELDETSLYTIQADQPDFIVPFHYRNVDDEVEFTYVPGPLCKLQYLYGPLSPERCTQLWSAILSPLLACSDWFMQPYSFILDPQHLYFDKTSQKVSYLYVPSRSTCSDYEGLKSMATELARQNPVSDAQIENQILRAIMQDFRPDTFLSMLKESQARSGRILSPAREPLRMSSPPTPAAAPAPVPAAPVQPKQESRGYAADDIVIRVSDGAKPSTPVAGKNKEKKGLFGDKSKEKKKGGGLFGRKNTEKEVLMGAAAPPVAKSNVVAPPLIIMGQPDGVTTLLTTPQNASPRLRLVSSERLPPFIEVVAENGRPFTIGRYDISVGKQQSSFEFAANTKTISRHHAVIEEHSGTYTILDLSSSAGTYVDGQKLTPNAPYDLQRGMCVSFGNGGADYIWEP